MLQCIPTIILQKEGIYMSESMKDYEAEIEASFRKINVGDIVTGTVIAVSEEA